VLLGLLNKHPEFSCTFSLTGVLVEQLKHHAPEVLQSFRQLARTGRVEFLAESYYHSLAFLYDTDEFKEQVAMHTKMIRDEFGQEPGVFRNTELIYNNDIAGLAQEMGYSAVLAEGADHVLGWKSCNYVYRPKGAGIKLLLKNHKLSDDIAFRFSQQEWDEWPLTAKKYAGWVHTAAQKSDVVNLFMDYETFGEHQWEKSGIFKFLEHFPQEVLGRGISFVTVSQAARLDARQEVDMPEYVSWADISRDLSAWKGNELQEEALSKLYALLQPVKESGNQSLIETWRKLSISDHFYYMSTKHFEDGDVHKYFSPFDSPYDAFIAYMNIINDLSTRVGGRTVQVVAKQ
jgi:alpha-amylase